MTNESDKYERLVEESVALLGSKQAVARWLGLSDHGQLNYRLTHPKSIRREQCIALESLISKVQYKPKHPHAIVACSCGGDYAHVQYLHQMGRHWQKMRCIKCKKLLMREMDSKG
jgi:hypothetical protein